jgi:rfaE bifunctional protein nucleotidyltransferase chain/domain
MTINPADKIQSIETLGTVARAAKHGGRSVVLAHGTFDLMHYGHVQHLQAAKREGDVLMVSVTADQFVNKGPDRPVFSQAIRAEMLAALGCVDYVGISEAATAESVLRTIRPDVYVKGSDYANPEDDVTGKIADELKVVHGYGGRTIFTNEVTYSSSSLINLHFDPYDPPLREFLNRLRASDGLARLTAVVERVRDLKVLMVGDTIVDEYQYVRAMGRSPKENMIATLFQDSELFAGGVIAAANHAAGFCREVEVLTALGGTRSHEALIRASLQPNVSLRSLERVGMPTTLKSRFVDQAYLSKLFEVYHMDDTPLADADEEQLIAAVRERAPLADVVIVTDFGHGLITPRVIAALTETASFLAVNAQSNSANAGFNLITKYPQADYICIDAPEARLAVADKYADVSRIISELLPARINCRRSIITNGRHGCVTWSAQEQPVHIPAFTKTVVDTVGAGDAFFSVTAPLVAAGAEMMDAGFLGNIAGALKVGIVGHRRSVSKPAVLKYLHTLLK